MIPIPAPVDRRRDRAVRRDHAAAAAELHGPLQSPPVRLDELETLGALVDPLAQGKGSIAAIAGEPGIGKSRTPRALADLAEFLAANFGDSALMLLISYRDIALSRRHPLSGTARCDPPSPDAHEPPPVRR
jgi:hypothetical protein